MGPSRLAKKNKKERRTDMAIQWFPSARGSQRHNAQPDSRELGRANQEALAEMDLGTRVSNSSKLSLELFGDFRTQHSAFLTFSCPGSHAPPQSKRRQERPHCPQDRAQRRGVKTEGQKRFVTLAANASDVQMP